MRYRAAVEGNDSEEENRFRDHHVFIEALYFFGKAYIWPILGRTKNFFKAITLGRVSREEAV